MQISSIFFPSIFFLFAGVVVAEEDVEVVEMEAVVEEEGVVDVEEEGALL